MIICWIIFKVIIAMICVRAFSMNKKIKNEDSQKTKVYYKANNIEQKENQIVDRNNENKEKELFKQEKETAKTMIKTEIERKVKAELEPKLENAKSEIIMKEVKEENYKTPPIELLSKGSRKNLNKEVIAESASKLQKILYSFGVSAKVVNVLIGPRVIRYEMKLAEGERISEITRLRTDISLNLMVKDVFIEPITEKGLVAIDVQKLESEIVSLRDIIDTGKFRSSKFKLTFAIGKDVEGKNYISDIKKTSHIIIGGTTGSGKSVCIDTLIISILYKSKPNEVKFVMIDPTSRLLIYNGIPHLLIPVVTDSMKAIGALAWAVQEMENRYQIFHTMGTKNLEQYNKEIEKGEKVELVKLPYFLIIIDEFIDLIKTNKKDVEEFIYRLTQKGRAAGIYLIIATQRPSVDVITGLVKANILTKIAFEVTSQTDSKIILDKAGAEKLLGKGDMLVQFLGEPKLKRIQGAYVSDAEVEKIVNFLKANREAKYNEHILESIENANKTDKEIAQEYVADDDSDPLLMDAIDIVVETGQASISFIQRYFKVNYARAGRIIDQMEERGIISGYQGSKPREVLVSKERLEELKKYISEEH